jgi:hypothetical protein
MARMSISLPRELKARIDAIGNRVNWSRLAQQVWERAAAEPMEGGTMNEMAQRLKASKAQCEERETALGHRCGKGWAEAVASYEDLKAVTKALETWNNNVPVADNITALLSEEVTEAIAQYYSEQKGQRNLGQPSPEFAYGFVDGAAEAFDAVAAQL